MPITTMHMAITTKPHTITSVLLGIIPSFSLHPSDSSRRPRKGYASLRYRAEYHSISLSSDRPRPIDAARQKLLSRSPTISTDQPNQSRQV